MILFCDENFEKNSHVYLDSAEFLSSIFSSLSFYNALIFNQLQVPLDSMCLYFSSLTTREQHSCTPAAY